MREGRRADGVHGAAPFPALSAPDVTVRQAANEDIDAMAQLWAEATAARDSDPDVAGLELSRPLVLDAMAKPGAVATVAVDGHEAVAFALSYLDQGVPEVAFVGASPARWGEGLAARVLEALTAELAAQGHERAKLYVYADNEPAIRLYERLGWTRASDEQPHPATGRPELRYTRSLA